jgi:hypothetical protein
MAKRPVESKLNGDINMFMTAKGGVGKTFISNFIAQWGIKNNRPFHVVDLDQSNAMLASLPELNAQSIQLKEENRFMDERFDSFVREIVKTDGNYLIDMGASTFSDVWRWMDENSMLEVMRHHGRKVVVHCVITGGEELLHTLGSFDEVCQQMDDRGVVVWINPFLGKVEQDGKTFDELKVYIKNRDKVLAIVNFPVAKDAVRRELKELAVHGKTALNVEADDTTDFLTKVRVAKFRDEAYSKIADVWGVIESKQESTEELNVPA